MITISLRNNFAEAFKNFESKNLARAQKAMAEALNHTALGVRADEVAEMRNVFDAPTPYTLNSLYVKRATPARLQAVVWFKTGYRNGKHFLNPQVYGGARMEKRFEFMLRRIGVLPPGMFAVPGNSATLDAHGNMSRGQIVQLLAYFQAFYLAGSTANTTSEKRARMAKGSRTKKGIEYIVIKQRRGGLIPGIWKVERGGLGRSIRPILIFIRGTSYSRRFDFDGVAQRSIDARFPGAWSKAWAATAGQGGRA